MVTSPDLIVFDVNETLSDMSALGAAFAAEGVPAHLARTWFAELLRDGFAAAAAGDNVLFAAIGRDGLVRLLTENGAQTPAASADRIMDAVMGLDVHPDVGPGIEALAPIADLVTLSNGSASVAEALRGRAGLRDRFSALLSVEDAPLWKPGRSAYSYAAEVCAREPGQMLLVAVHPWDIQGAHAAGLRTAWINRTGAQYPVYFSPPDLEAPDLPSLAEQLGGGQR